MPPDVAFTTVSLGLLHTCALDTEGRAWCWGYNSLGELGDGNQGTPAPAPIQVATPEGIVLVDLGLGMSHSCAIDDSGLGWCWGYNDQGQLGGGISGSRDIPDVVEAPPGTTFLSISGGFQHTCAVDTTDVAWCWGNNSSGQIGDGTTTPRSTPVEVVDFP